MYLTTFIILSLHVAIIVIFHSLHTFPFLKLVISGLFTVLLIVICKGINICLLSWQHSILAHLLFHLIVLDFPEDMEYIPFKLSFKKDPSRFFRMESTMHPWYSFNFGKCNSCLTFHSSGPSCWAFSILTLLHHTCASLARSIYHSYLTGMSTRLLNMKLLGALNSCTIHHTGLCPLLTWPPVVTTIRI